MVSQEKSYAMDQESEIIESKEEEGDIDTNSKKEPEVQVEAALLSEEERHLSSSDGDARKAKRDANVARAIELQKSGAVLEASIWQANSGGVLISDSSSGLTGYVPFGFLSPSSARRVISAQSKLRSTRKMAEEDDPALFARQLKRQGMEILLGETICIRVVSVDEENGRVICSEKQDSDTIEPLTEANVLHIAESFLGTVVDVEVKSIKEFGVFVQFEIPGDISHRKYLGLVHSSEISWEQDDQPEIVPGAMLQAKIIHADVTKKRVFFSFKRTKANPLLETLDSLLAPSFNENRKDASNGTRNTFDSSSDMRPLLGDLQDALQLREQLCQISQITQVTLGPRLQSRASAQNVEIYLGKDGSSTNGGEGGTYKLIVRKGFDVQEMSVSANLTRAEFVAIIAPKAR
jgi:predicted RNA-binding protein with RPS1 domain